jgi:hypothetical protein
MAEILSFGEFEKKGNSPNHVRKNVRAIFQEIKGLNLFTKLTIVILVLFAIFAFRISTELFQYFNFAQSNQTEVGKSLPSNCHLAVDLTTCSQKAVCKPEPIVVCDKNQ